MIAVGRQRGAKPAYDKSQRCITCEEDMLVTEFGEAYQVYRQQTRWRLVPLIY